MGRTTLIKRLAQENAIMAEIGRTITSSLDIEEVYQRFAEEVMPLVGKKCYEATPVKANVVPHVQAIKRSIQVKLPTRSFRKEGFIKK